MTITVRSVLDSFIVTPMIRHHHLRIQSAIIAPIRWVLDCRHLQHKTFIFQYALQTILGYNATQISRSPLSFLHVVAD